MTERKDRSTLTVDLGELKPLVLQAAEREQKKAAVWVREVLSVAVQEHLEHPVPAAKPSRAAGNRRPGAAVVHFGGRLTAEESRALGEAAAAEGLSQIEYVVCVATGDLRASKMQALEGLGELKDRLLSLEVELRALRLKGQEAGAQAQLERAARELRVQARRTAELLDGLTKTRRTVARSRRQE